jgi:hypothetical protein
MRAYLPPLFGVFLLAVGCGQGLKLKDSELRVNLLGQWELQGEEWNVLHFQEDGRIVNTIPAEGESPEEDMNVSVHTGKWSIQEGKLRIEWENAKEPVEAKGIKFINKDTFVMERGPGNFSGLTTHYFYTRRGSTSSGP